MGEKLKLGPPTTPEEENEFILDRNAYLLEYIAKQEEQLGIDHLTGLKNRKAFEAELERSLKATCGREEDRREKGSEALKELSLIFIDLDNFKQVNDTLGHLAGDDVLRRVADLLRRSVREADVIARFGGDEFYILLPHASEEDGKAIASKIRENLEHDPKFNGLNVTASIGVASVDASISIDATALIKRADDAAGIAKNSGKNQVAVHTQTENEAA